MVTPFVRHTRRVRARVRAKDAVNVILGLHWVRVQVMAVLAMETPTVTGRHKGLGIGVSTGTVWFTVIGFAVKGLAADVRARATARVSIAIRIRVALLGNRTPQTATMPMASYRADRWHRTCGLIIDTVPMG